MYNLKRLNPDIARDEFYHWKLHVAAFLEQNWTTLFGPQMKKRKTWLGTISGTMSHWSGVIFRSGLTTLKESGWWKLISDELPRDLLASAPSSVSRTGQSSQSHISLLKASTNEPISNAVSPTQQVLPNNCNQSSKANLFLTTSTLQCKGIYDVYSKCGNIC